MVAGAAAGSRDLTSHRGQENEEKEAKRVYCSQIAYALCINMTYKYVNMSNV